jgi:hypothetical protein
LEKYLRRRIQNVSKLKTNMAKNIVNIVVENYKLLESFDQQFESGHLYFIKGGNSQGKTSFMNMICENLSAEVKTKNPITFGKENGTSVLSFIGADGKQYSIRADYNQNGNHKFSIIFPTMDKSTKVTDIRNWAKFNGFTVEDWMSWSLTAEGRRKQTEILQKFIPEESQKRIAEIDAKINNKNGELYKQRTEVGKSLDVEKSVVKNFELNPAEIEMVEKHDATIEALAKLQTQVDELTKKQNTLTTANATIDEKKKNLSSLQDSRMQSDKLYEDAIIETEKRILELEKELVKQKNILVEQNNQWKAAKETSDKAIKELEAQIESTEEVPDYSEEIAAINKQIEAGKEYRDKCILAVQKKQTLTDSYKKAGDLQAKYDNLSKEIDVLREEKQNIYSKSELPADNIVIEDGETFLSIDDNLVPFAESDMSYSTAGKIVARMLAKLNNSTGIILLGKAAEYDRKSLDELAEIAEKENCIMFCDYVVEDGEGLEVVVHSKSN